MALINGLGQRRLGSWIQAFLELTKNRQSPELFRKWAAITCIAGALERKVWVKAFGLQLYPNMFTVLTGGPGVGKTVAIREVEFFWRSLTGLYVAPDSVTRASLIDDLMAAKRKILRPNNNPPFIEFHSLQCAAEEFGVFIPQYEGEFINTLNKLYDCGKQFEESRRGNKGERRKFLNPQLTILGGTTPSYLKDSLPEGAWQQGFTSRIVLIHSGETVAVEPWREYAQDEKLEEDLLHDIRRIFSAYGQFIWEDRASDAFRNWYMSGREPAPDHPKLEHYLPRRHTHLLKLCMVFSIARSDELLIRLEDYQLALDTLVEAEANMPDVFKAMSLGGDGNIVDETYRFVWQAFAKEKKDISEHRVIYFLIQRVPSYSADKILESMIASQLFSITSIGEKGRRTLRPNSRS